MRIFDALNDVDNVKSTVKYVKQYGGIADCAVCYTVDPKYPELGFWARLMGKKNPAPVFTDAYFLDKARQMAALGADMITIKDMSGPDSAAPRGDARAALQEEPLHPGRFPYPLYAGLRPGIGAFGHRRRCGHRRYQLLVLCRRYGSSGHRAGLCLLQEAGYRHGCEHGGRGEDQYAAAGDPEGAQPVGIRHREARTESLQSADGQASCRDRSTLRQGDRGCTAR